MSKSVFLLRRSFNQISSQANAFANRPTKYREDRIEEFKNSYKRELGQIIETLNVINDEEIDLFIKDCASNLIDDIEIFIDGLDDLFIKIEKVKFEKIEDLKREVFSFTDHVDFRNSKNLSKSLEIEMYKAALIANNGVRNRVAGVLGVSIRTVTKKLKEYNLVNFV